MQYIRIKSRLSNTMDDILTQQLIEGLRYSATSPTCVRALAWLMASDYDGNYLAQIATDLFNTKARIGRVK
jgi:hypothetical protein